MEGVVFEVVVGGKEQCGIAGCGRRVPGAKRNERAVIPLRALHFYGLSDRHAT